MPGPRDTYGVGGRVLELIDTRRATPADPEAQRGPIPESDTRAISTTVFYPTDERALPDANGLVEPIDDAPPADGRFPVILFSHGAPGTPHDYRRMLQRWASEGFIVVAPQYPISSTAGPTDVAWGDARNQIRDASFVLTQVLQRNRDAWTDGGFGGHLDPSRIGAAGHSMGGFTTLGLVSECCRDKRVDGALVLAGVSDGERGPRITNPSGPVLFAHATLDFAVPLQQATRAYRAASTPKYLVEIDLPIAGVAAHILPFTEGFGRISDQVTEVLDSFLAAYVGGDPDAAERLAPTAEDAADLKVRYRT